MNAIQAWLISVVVLGSVYWPLEWAWPAREGQRWLRARVGTDFLFLTGQYLLWNAVALSVLLFVRAQADLLGPLTSFRALAQQQPFALQLLEAVLLGDLSVYWFHRASHRFELLWRFHAVHHTSETVDWIAAHREHPVDGVLTQLFINLPGIVLGFDFATISSFIVFRGLWAIFIHSNVRLPLGPLAYLFGSPQWHRWHHAKNPGVVANFANLSPWCDFLFRTHHRGAVGNETYELGVPESWPTSYPGQLLAPFLPRAWWPRVFGSLTPAPAVSSQPASAVMQTPDANVLGRGANHRP